MQYISVEELAQRLAGCAFDGQYILEGVHAVLLKIVGGKLTWCTVRWDPAHQVELALNDVRMDKTGVSKLRTVEWYKPLSESISLLVNSFQYGKGYEEIRALAAKLQVTLLNPAKFCETRFVQSETKVIKSLLENWPLYVGWYEVASSIPAGATKGKGNKLREKLNADEKAKLALLHQLKDIMFVGRLLFLHDLFQHVRKFSLMAQTVNVLPWELREEEDRLLAMLKSIYEAADASEEAEESRRTLGSGPLGADGAANGVADGAALLLPKFFPGLYANNTWAELKLGRYKGITLVLPLDETDEESDEGADERPRFTLAKFEGWFIDEAHDFVKALHHFLVIRLVQCKGVPRQGEKGGGHQYVAEGGKEARQLIETMGRCFDLRKLCMNALPTTDNIEALRVIHAAATDSGVVMPPLSTLELQLGQVTDCVDGGHVLHPHAHCTKAPSFCY